MKKVILSMFCLFLASSFTGIFAQQQSLQQQQIEKVEQKVQEFIQKNIQKQIPQEKLMRFKNSFDLKEHGFLFKNLSIQEQEELLDYHKRKQLRTLYFKTFPDDRQVYAPEVAPVCLNGGFEDGNFNNYQGFSAEDDSSNNGGYDGGECTAVPVNGLGNFAWTPVNLFGATAEFDIVPAGNDPIIALNGANLSTVNPFNTDPTNNFAAKINAPTPCSPNHGIDRLVKPITLQESGTQEIRFYYALVSEFPDHTNANPFFTARALNAAGVEEDRMCIVSNPAGNPFFNEITNPQSPTGCGYTTILWQDWTCATLEVSGNAGDVITLEFIMADCGAGAHFGYAYIDDICAESCEGGDNFQGSIELNPFDPCEVTFPFDVCADFTLPQLNGQTGTLTANNTSLEILQNGNVATTLTNGVITGNTVCFTVNANDFVPQNGGFDFQVNATFGIGNGTQMADDTHTTPGQNNDYIFDNPDCCNDEPYIVPFWQHPACPEVVCTADQWPIHVKSIDGSNITNGNGITVVWDNLDTAVNENLIQDWIFASALENWQATITYPNGCEYIVTYFEDCCDEDIFIKVYECPTTPQLQALQTSLEKAMETARASQSATRERDVQSSSQAQQAQIQDDLDRLRAYMEARASSSGEDCDPCELEFPAILIELVDANGDLININDYDTFSWDHNGSQATAVLVDLPMPNGPICFTATNIEYGKECVYQDCFFYECEEDPCAAPTDLRFDCRRAGMSWTGDPSLTYVVEVTWDDPNCRSCKGTRPNSIRWEVQGTSFQLPFIDRSGCFSWRVGTKCKDGVIWSRSQCIDCYVNGPTKPHDVATDVKTQAKIYPNPNDGNMNIEISGNDKTTFALKVYRFDGTLIKTFNENRIENQSIKISWNGKNVLSKGMYFFVITTDKETITKKVVIE